MPNTHASRDRIKTRYDFVAAPEKHETFNTAVEAVPNCLRAIPAVHHKSNIQLISRSLVAQSLVDTCCVFDKAIIMSVRQHRSKPLRTNIESAIANIVVVILTRILSTYPAEAPAQCSKIQ